MSLAKKDQSTASLEKLATDSKNALDSTKPQPAEQRSTKKSGSKGRSEANLNRRGRKPRTVLSAKEIAFCVYFIQSGDVKYASIQGGFNPWRGYELLKLPRIQSVLPELESRKKEECWGDANKKTGLMREGADDAALLALQIVLRKMETDPTLVGMALAKLIDIIYKRTGNIGQNVTPAAQHAPQNAANTKGFKSQVYYTSPWVRELYGIHDPRSEAVDREFDIDPVSGELPTLSKDNSSSDAIKLVESGGNATADPAREPVPSLITPPPADQPVGIAKADDALPAFDAKEFHQQAVRDRAAAAAADLDDTPRQRMQLFELQQEPKQEAEGEPIRRTDYRSRLRRL